MTTTSKLKLLIGIIGVKLLVVLCFFAAWITLLVQGDDLRTETDSLLFLRNALLVVIILSVFFVGFIYRLFRRFLARHEEERRHVMKKLEAYSARLTSFMESPEYVSIYSLDRDLKYTGFNSLHKDEMKTYFHSDVAEGDFILDKIPQDIRERMQRNYQRALNGEHFTVTSLFRDHYYTQIFNPIFDENDGVIGLTSNVFEVTDRIKAEQELENYKDQLEELVKKRTRQLEQQSEFFQRIIDSLPNLIFVRDENHRYILVNQAMADSLGMQINEFTGRSIEEIHSNAKEAERFEREDQVILENSSVFEQESSHTYPNGVNKWLYLSKHKMEIDGEPYVLGVLNDISSLKETEHKLLAANDELKQTLKRLRSAQMRLIESEKMASLGQLTAGLAHEINNPINYVSGNVGPIRQDLSELKEYVYTGKSKQTNFDMLFSELDSLLDGVDEGATRVKDLMSDLNAFSLPEGTKRTLCNLNNSMRSTINLVQYQLKGRILLESDFGDIPPVKCNAQQISQVFLNLLNNAIQAIEEKGTITVKTRLKGDMVVIKIRDTGSGIAPEHMKRIFDPFFTTKDVGKGTGLGLSMSYRIIKEHGGKITVTSEPGNGAVFKISIPAI